MDDGTGPVAHTWDPNGNLLSDGTSTYTYNYANRLTSVISPQSTSSYEYNGLRDRLLQTVDGVTTNYTLDLAVGLTQVLADGHHTYLNGLGRLAQQNMSGTEYFLPDALASVRQLVAGNGTVTLAQDYTPCSISIVHVIM